ncbi:MAG: hypothetical protein R3E01_10120 [Pirellulaceae bacterium]|nr:hypothetical protein [Planctomycetales bacterium]
MNQNLTVTREFHATRRHHGRKQFRDGSAPDVPTGRVPRIARLMAMAIRCHQLIRDGVVTDQAELAHFGHITPSRMAQIMMLLNLAPTSRNKSSFSPASNAAAIPSKRTTSVPSRGHSTGASSGGCG